MSPDNVLLMLLAFAVICAAGWGALAMGEWAQRQTEQQPQPAPAPYEIRTNNPWGTVR
jgi:hypothetical protein